jgi:hypothetical protein
MVHIWTSVVAREKLQVRKQVGIREKNVVDHGVGSSTTTNYNLVPE